METSNKIPTPVSHIKPFRAGRALSSFLFFAVGTYAAIYAGDALVLSQMRSATSASRLVQEATSSIK